MRSPLTLSANSCTFHLVYCISLKRLKDCRDEGHNTMVDQIQSQKTARHDSAALSAARYKLETPSRFKRRHHPSIFNLQKHTPIYSRIWPLELFWTVAVCWLVHLGVQPFGDIRVPYGSQKRVPQSGTCPYHKLWESYLDMKGDCCHIDRTHEPFAIQNLGRVCLRKRPVLNGFSITFILPRWFGMRDPRHE